MEHVEITSDRFLLRTLTVDDASRQYLGWFQNTVVKKYITYAEQQRSLEELRGYIAEKSAKDDVLFFGIFLKDKLFHIGNIKYEPVNSEFSYAVMGILIGEKEWQGKGVGPEVISSSAIWLHQEKGIKQIVLGVDAGNVNAIKAYEKIGFVIQQTPYINAKSEDNLTMVWNL